MKLNLLLCFLMLFTALTGSSQPYTLYPAALPDLGYSAAAWGDYDRDGDLDLALTGMQGSSNSVSKIFRNDAGIFTDLNAPISGLMSSTAAWGDYDGDDDLDLLLTGSNDFAQPTTVLVRNDNGVFTDALAGLPGVADGAAAWGDYDRDGDLDILLAGNLLARVIRNEGNGTFAESGQHFPALSKASASWCDYNNDGWPDVLIGGETGSGPVTELYRNDQGTFTLVNAGFSGLSDGMARWTDLNKDGREDLVAGGIDKYGLGQLLIYQNNGDGQFTEITTYTMNAMSLAIDFADFDNDGYQDMIVIGKIQGCGPTALTMLYHNEGYMIFTDVSTLITGVKYGQAIFGDVNGDGLADLLFTGLNAYETPVTDLYLNNAGNTTFAVNLPPALPVGLVSETSGQKVTLSWNTASDPETPGFGLSYNLFIGNSPVSAGILSPMASLASGFRRVAALGNTCADTSWSITSLQPGTYFWSVQAIDNGFAPSAFSPVQSFTILETSVNELRDQQVRIFPNPVISRICLDQPEGYAGNVYEITELSGKVVQQGGLAGSCITVRSLPAGVYFLRIDRGKPLRFLKTE